MTTDRVEPPNDPITPPAPLPVNPIDHNPTDHAHSNKSVMFAPLSPTSSRRLERIRNAKANNSSSTIQTYEQPDPSPDHRHRRRRRRRNSDPSSDRPSRPHKHRRRRGASSDESASGSENSDIEVLPDRFDDDGRPIERDRDRERSNLAKEFGGGNEMVEKVVRGVGEVVEGRKTWGQLLRGLVAETMIDPSEASGSDAERERRGGRRKSSRSRSRSRGGDY